MTAIVGLAVVVLVVAGLIALLVWRGGAAAGPRGGLGVESGKVVYSDSLSDPSSGWQSLTLPSGSTIGYENGAYVINGQGDKSHYTRAPYHVGYPALGVAVSAAETSGDAVDGFGVECDHGGDSGNQYAFFLHSDGRWGIDRYVPDASGVRQPLQVRSGSSSAFGGLNSTVHVEAACINTGSSGTQATTRLLLTVDGRQLADTSDTVSDDGGTLWFGGVMTSTAADQPSVVQFSSFSLRNLEG